VDEEVDGVVSVWENSGGGVEHGLDVPIVDSLLAERSVDVAEEVDVGRYVEHEERTAGRDQHQRRWSHLNIDLTNWTSHALL